MKITLDEFEISISASNRTSIYDILQSPIIQDAITPIIEIAEAMAVKNMNLSDTEETTPTEEEIPMTNLRRYKANITTEDGETHEGEVIEKVE